MYFNYLDTKIYYETTGNGQPIVFLHGWQSSSGSFSLLKQQLQHSYKLIFIDFPPFGKSGKLLFSWSVETYADMVVALLDYINVQNFCILAHSFGGRVAINICTCYNNKVKKLILTGSAGLKPKKSFLQHLKEKKYKYLKKQALKGKQINLQNYGSQDFKALDDLMKQTFVKIVNYHQEQKVKKISIPTLLIYGEKDTETPIYMAKKFKRLIKNSKLEIIKNAGHFCFIGQNELFYHYVIHFLT